MLEDATYHGDVHNPTQHFHTKLLLLLLLGCIHNSTTQHHCTWLLLELFFSSLLTAPLA
jgi:hypothetical protein